ncbi:amylosucrase [Alishewanella longhuensis]
MRSCNSLLRCAAVVLVLGSGSTEILQSGNQHLFAYRRQLDQQSVLCVVNFSEAPQPFTSLPASSWQDELTATRYQAPTITLQPYQVLWLTPAS